MNKKTKRSSRAARVRTAATAATAGDYSGALPAEAEGLTTRIIEILQEDGRTPYSTIASTLSVSEGTVRNRVRQLIDDHVITIQAEALPGAFGYRFNAMTMLKVAPGADIGAVAERFSSIPEVYYLVMMLGRFDLGAATYHRSEEDFRKFLESHCYGHKDVATIETNLVLKIHKMKLRWKLFNTDA
jgi:Lrp/AsnC family transcriptional regulator, regulator for asnA, asnC and gidA